MALINRVRTAVSTICGVRYAGSISTDLSQYIHGNSRRAVERKDSLTIDILRERQYHHDRMISLNRNEYISYIDVVESLGLGVKRRKGNVYRISLNPRSQLAEDSSISTGAGQSITSHLIWGSIYKQCSYRCLQVVSRFI
jgi:hypothetical protein